ncbi:hypothetical protein W97_08908 [Coniosporium apollinis CBS 100218]|uniref:Fibronectin type-III domain-containing protein n=1 Tax=Coniosporium apollinis (strain CBS 100218) TaxID=1168221 RepID=R7Z6C9_CONA1|nr:uncharacterized protein W97_08908 [Coniosporium apollinis CBS 100218]EON69648.1 hypothetical protein W97_08908 [Coniosporium apollinis CBS 100218]
MEGLASFTSSWLQTLCTFAALFWLFARAYQVLAKPVDELVNLLGLEVPVAPIVSLAGIKADGCILHWKAPDPRGSVTGYKVQLNGIIVGEVTIQDTSIQVRHLQPNHYYTIRVIAVSPSNFHAASEPIRLRTRPAASEDYFEHACHSDDKNGAACDGHPGPAPSILPYKAFSEASTPTPSPPSMAREHSSQPHARRGTVQRRHSPASLDADEESDPPDTSRDEDSIEQLTAKFESLMRENEDIEKQIAEEEQEFQRARDSLLKQRDHLKQQLKDREDASRELKKQVASLERANATAQARRATQEKLLQQKQSERQKIRDDMKRWQREIGELHADVERMEREKCAYQETSAKQIVDMRNRHAEEQQTNRALDQAIREKGVQIKELEDRRKSEADERETGGRGYEEISENEQDRQAEERKDALLTQYNIYTRQLQQASYEVHQLREQLKFINQSRASQPQVFSPPGLDGATARPSTRRRRTDSIRNEAVSSTGFAIGSGPPFKGSMSSISPTFASPPPFFNVINGMTNYNATVPAAPSQSDIELIGPLGPMSPTAGSLLPSGLFDKEDDFKAKGNPFEENMEANYQGKGKERMQEDPSSHAEEEAGRRSTSPAERSTKSSVLPGHDGMPRFPGLGALGTLEQAVHSPTSPSSFHSPSPSVFASPRESAAHLSNLSTAEGGIESDRQSIRSTSGSYRTPSGGVLPGSTRFAQLFNLNRQRGKTIEDGPPLGSLKGSQSHSMPREDRLQDDAGQRRRGSHSYGTWGNLLSNPLGRSPGSSSKLAGGGESDSSPKSIATRKRAFNLFGPKADALPKGDGWPAFLGMDRPASPRPGSVRSFDRELPRPSSESVRKLGWAASMTTSPLNDAWSGMTATYSFSRHPSRRPSVQYSQPPGLAYNMPLPENDPHELSDLLHATSSPLQDPIGTHRPLPGSQTPSLNPAAPSFLSRFNLNRDKSDRSESSDKEAKKAEKAAEKAEKAEKKKREKANKSREKDRQQASSDDEPSAPQTPRAETPATADTSPSESRKSKDNRSISTANDSTYGDLDRTPSESLGSNVSMSAGVGSAGKESFMQKLSRKSSSTKFPFNKSGGLFSSSKRGSEGGFAPDTPDDDNEGVISKADSSQQGSPMLGSEKGEGGRGNRSSGLSWSSFKGKMGKKGDKAPSLSESFDSVDEGVEED